MPTPSKRELVMIVLLMEQGYTLFHSTGDGTKLSKEVNGQVREVNLSEESFRRLYEGEMLVADDQANAKIAYDVYQGLYYQLASWAATSIQQLI